MSDAGSTTYELTYRCKGLLDGSTSLPEMAERLIAEATHLMQMHNDGVALRDDLLDDWGFLVTTDKPVADKHDMDEMHEEEYDADEAMEDSGKGAQA